MKNLFRKAFLGGFWAIAYKRKNDETFTLVPNQKSHWNADPFIVQRDNALYLFTEFYDTKKDIGRIAVSQLCNGEMLGIIELIKSDTHMSFPFVFEIEGNYYLIPENSQSKTVPLYKFINFPNKLCFVRNIFNNVNYVDCFIEINKGSYYLIGYDDDKKSLFSCLLSHDFLPLGEVHYYGKSLVSRPAGAVINGKIRPSQYNEKKYGESIVLNDFAIKNSIIVEERKELIEASKIRFSNSNKIPNKIHTINETKDYVVIDVFFEKVDLFRWFKMIRRKRHKK